MPDSQPSQEFSICLLVDDITRDHILNLRGLLPPSPYRDDPPHLTVLRGLTAATELSDKQLLNKIISALSLTSVLPLRSIIKEVTNMGNEMYSSSGLLIMESSPELLELRHEAIETLTGRGFSLEAQERAHFTPHITVRLGVPLEGQLMEKAKDLFEGRKVSLNQWLLFRVVNQGSKRLIREVRPK